MLSFGTWTAETGNDALPASYGRRYSRSRIPACAS
jgi:hypothetical protein